MGLRIQTKHGAEKLPKDMRTVLINQSKLRKDCSRVSLKLKSVIVNGYFTFTLAITE